MHRPRNRRVVANCDVPPRVTSRKLRNSYRESCSTFHNRNRRIYAGFTVERTDGSRAQVHRCTVRPHTGLVARDI